MIMTYGQGDKLRKARENSHFTQQHVADALGVDRSTYASYEIGRSQPSSSTLVALAKIFRVPLEQLVDEEFLHAFVRDYDDREVDADVEEETSAYLSKIPTNIHIEDLSNDERALLCLYRVASPELQQEMMELFMQRLHGTGKKSTRGCKKQKDSSNNR